jgi:hypothetical protein
VRFGGAAAWLGEYWLPTLLHLYLGVFFRQQLQVQLTGEWSSNPGTQLFSAHLLETDALIHRWTMMADSIIKDWKGSGTGRCTKPHLCFSTFGCSQIFPALSALLLGWIAQDLAAPSTAFLKNMSSPLGRSSTHRRSLCVFLETFYSCLGKLPKVSLNQR